MEIIPAILPKNYEDLKNKIALVRGIADSVQIDICDGVFVKSITWPFNAPAHSGVPFLSNNFDEHFLKILNEEEGLPFWEDIEFELDLMVADAIANFDVYAKLGPKKIIFHLEPVEIQTDLVSFRDFLDGIDMYVRDIIEIGVAINSSTPVEQIFPLVNSIDFVQVMGIEKIGYQGQEFDRRVLVNIEKLKQKFPDLIISVDGGVNFDTAPELLSAGADRLIIGSAIFSTDDIIGTIERFKSLK